MGAAWLALSEALEGCGDLEGARAALESAEAEPGLGDSTTLRRAELALAQGNLADALELTEGLVPSAGPQGPSGRTLRIRALAQLDADPESAARLARAASLAHVRAAQPHGAALARLIGARAMLLCGRHAEAALEAEEAAAALTDAGAIGAAAEARALRESIRPDAHDTRRARHRAGLLALAEEVGRALPLATLVPSALARVADIASCDRAALLLCDGRGVVHRAFTHGFVEGAPGYSASLVAEVVRSGRRAVVDDAQEVEAYALRASIRDAHIRFVCGVPVHGRMGVMGVLYADGQSAAAEPDLEVLEAVSRLLGTALESARLIGAERERGDKVGTLFRTLRPFLDRIREDQAALLSGDVSAVRQAGERVRQIALDMSQVVNDTIALARIEEGHDPGTPVRVDVGEVVRRRVEALSHDAQGREVTLAARIPDGLPSAHTVREYLDLALNRTLLAALSRATPREEVRLAVALRADPGPAPVGGDVVEPLMQSSLPALRPRDGAAFVEVRVAASAAAEDAAALGLFEVRRCVQHLGGRAWLEASELPSLAFTVPTEVDVDVRTRDVD